VVAVAFAFASLGMEWFATTFRRIGLPLVAAAAILSAGYGSAMLARGLGGARPRIPCEQAFAWLNGHPEILRVLILDAAVPPYFLKKDYLKLRGPARTGSDPCPARSASTTSRLPSVSSASPTSST
jgi:hypothetical protein